MKLIITQIFIAVLFISHLSGAVIHVPADTSSIQAAINIAGNGDTVLVAEGTYYENINFKGKAITVASEFIMDDDTSHISKTIIDGSQPSNPDSGSVVYFISGEDSTSVLCGFTVTHGSGTIYSFYDQWYGTVTTYKAAGGILVDSSGASIKYNYIQNNKVNNYTVCGGGGIVGYFTPEDKSLLIENNKIINNSLHGFVAAFGGGLSHFNIWGYCSIKENIISHNVIRVDGDYKAVGGGIDCEFDFPASGEVIIAENIISYNELHCEYSYGAGMYFVHWETPEEVHDHYSTPVVYNNIISNNYSQDAGAGVTVWLAHRGAPEYLDMSPHPVFINNTIVNNKASRGSGIYCWNASFLLMNNILWNDLSAPGCTEISMGDGGDGWSSRPNEYNRIYIHNSLISDGNWNNFTNKVFDLDPIFSDTLYHLSENSPAAGMGRSNVSIDGANYQAPAYDINGNIRPNPIDTLIDIGAFESGYVPTFVYPKSLEIADEITYLNPATDYLGFTSDIDNPDNHSINVFARIVSVDNARIDSIELYDDGAHNDGESGDLVFAGEFEPINEENEFRLSLGIKDNNNGDYSVFNDNKRITTTGPIKVANYFFLGTDVSPSPGDIMRFKIILRNDGQNATAQNTSAHVTSLDPNVELLYESNPYVGDIPPNQTLESEGFYRIKLSDNINGENYEVIMRVDILSGEYPFWVDSTSFVVSIIKKDSGIPAKFSLGQNHPNPFNPETQIDFSLPKSEYVELKVFNILGKEVATLVSGKLNSGNHTFQFDGSNLASGIYLYRIEAGEYSQVMKMILLR